ncbi:hypothetical protein [Burkholderia sp. Nafp2/4-1b]|nr:hypothetical protein [Burkholderia sp. Nafp2/4-1b]
MKKTNHASAAIAWREGHFVVTDVQIRLPGHRLSAVTISDALLRRLVRGY